MTDTRNIIAAIKNGSQYNLATTTNSLAPLAPQNIRKLEEIYKLINSEHQREHTRNKVANKQIIMMPFISFLALYFVGITSMRGEGINKAFENHDYNDLFKTIQLFSVFVVIPVFIFYALRECLLWSAHSSRIIVLNEALQSISELNVVYNLKIDISTTTMREANSKLSKKINTLDQDNKNLLTELRVSFLMGRAFYKKDPAYIPPIPQNMPNEIAHKILFFAGLFAKPPAEIMHPTNYYLMANITPPILY